MNQNNFKELALRAVALLGLLAVLLLGAWGIIQLAFFISSLFSGMGGAVSTSHVTPPAHETITLSLPAQATAGQPVSVSWNHLGGSGNYGYSLSYSCATDVSFKAPVPTGNTQTVKCDTPFNYTQATSSMAITPEYSGTADATVHVTVVATNLSTGAVTAQTSGTMTIHPTKVAASKPSTPTGTTKPSTPSKSKPGATYVPSHRTTNLYGYSDLAVYVTSVNAQSGSGRIIFTVENVGTNMTPSNWSLLITLPSGYQYPSGPQQALYPGDKIVYTLDFSDVSNGAYGGSYGTNPYAPYNNTAYNPWNCSNAAYGYSCAAGADYSQGNLTIAVDPYNQIAETNKGNNTATAYVGY